mgnify:CR=1 FL=1
MDILSDIHKAIEYARDNDESIIIIDNSPPATKHKLDELLVPKVQMIVTDGRTKRRERRKKLRQKITRLGEYK